MIIVFFRNQASQVPPVKEEMAPEEVRKKFELSWSRFGGDAGKDEDDKRGSLNSDFRGSVEMVDLMEETQKDQLPEEQVAEPDKVVNVVWPLFSAFGFKFGESILLKIAQVCNNVVKKSIHCCY